MEAIKVIVGSGCLILAIFLGIPLANVFKSSSDIPLAMGCCWLAGMGVFLIAKRTVPLSKSARAGLLLSGGLWVALVLLIGLPNFIKARGTSCCNACINNLRQIDAAANQLALERNLKAGDPIKFPDDLTPYIKLNSAGKIPSCPQGGIYHIGKVGEAPTCSLGSTITPNHILP